MEMGKPNEQHKKLETLVGTWTGEETMHPSPWCPQPSKATGRLVSKMDLDGFFLVTDYIQEKDGKVSYRGHGVYGWDGFKKYFTMHWFDSMGCDPGAPAVGTWEGNRLSFQSKHEMGHGRYTYEFAGKDSYTFKLEHSQDGKNWMPFMDATYKRAGK